MTGAEPTQQRSASKPRRTASQGEQASDASASKDVLYVHSPTESGEGYNVIRHRQDRLEVGELRELREGKPVVGEVVRLTPRQQQERLFDVEVLLESPNQLPAKRQGPARVSSDVYRANWDAIFGKTTAHDAGGNDRLN